ncbi:MAG: 50S ribosomal protein L17 [Deltaproteobacteria bacterium]|nr:50S ribosomal protein L17 [Deltaproteobacteria bacterium]
MNHKVVGRKLGRTSSHRKAMLGNLASSLFVYGRVKTTLEKAKEVRSLAERLVGWAKNGSLHSKRLARGHINQKAAFIRLFNEIGKRFETRNGGYTRIYRAGWRAGDAARMAYLELLGEEFIQIKKEKHEHNHKKQDLKRKEKSSVKIAEKIEEAEIVHEKKHDQQMKSEDKQAQELEVKQHKKSLFRRATTKGTARSGNSKKGVS